MTVLIVGAGGFIGRHLVAGLRAAGHAVRPAGTDPAALRALFPGLDPVRADYATDDAAAWAPRLAGIDIVVNAAGLIREAPGRSFRRIHAEGPKALFDACRAARVGKVLQISALGADAGAETAYHLSKREADRHLQALDPTGQRLNWCVLRPSLVLGPGGASTALFTALAALPVPPRLGPGDWAVQPIHVDDLVRIVAVLAAYPGPLPRVLDVVGPEPVTTDGLIRGFRNWLGLPPRPFVPLPAPLLRLAAGIGDRLPRSPVTSQSLAMLRRGNTAPAEPLVAATGIRPRPLAAQLAALPAPRAALRTARLDLLRPTLRWSIALLWLWTCAVSLGLWPLSDSLAMVERVGPTGPLALALTIGAALWDGALGLALALRWRPVLTGGLMLATMAAFTAIISLFLPEYWLHPFGPVAKNLPLAVATLVMMALED
ncbi:MAG TPA: SDR family oxidoreductase [Alphaproteobacteria bacterium]|nr:SDR family oxidoreductase [Alphaproteobacteria bacterium]